jgi:hypothetical protein
MRSVGKRLRDESGKYPVNENDEEIVHRVNPGTRDRPGKATLGIADALSASLRAKQSNPSHDVTDRWIASSLRSLAQTLRVCRRQ